MFATEPCNKEHAPAGENPHYIQAVAELGTERAVIANDDIYSASGVKLVAKGVRLTPLQFERLTQHKLTAPLDHMLASEHPVDADFLATMAARVLDHEPVYARLAARSGDPLAVKHALAGLKLPKPVQLRLTVMRERRTEMFEHSIRCGIIAHAMAQRMGLPAAERGNLLMAAISHDFGEMHTDPAMLAAGHDIAPDERCFIHVHPITGYVLLHEIAGYPAAAAAAVLHHHERVDGSGYPHGLRGERIPPLARLLAVADVAETVIRRFDLPRLDVLIRLNQARFDHKAVDTLRDLIHATPRDAAYTPNEHGAMRQLTHLAEVLRAWSALRASFEAAVAPRDAGDSPLAFLFERMASIRGLVLQCGFDPDHADSMLGIAREDPGLLLELRALLDEMEWLLLDLAHEIERRGPEMAGLPQIPIDGLVMHLQPARLGQAQATVRPC
ncbi:HD-GYP domain-containing protein [Pseudoduganella namucuonensis]|uniref:HD domain-containing protein n=1 Tax=Pseudoduganella namucuonensis TaxID=1035707 RepID=A0A1I7LY83_9BURK|nr:HD domain-containing phosphohydrolase [Pseudoduganella namucuonensis]SFV14666.1 HD domain-containing protein [Pseudoduganella namucuonensis]